jgi:hypothetical protein
MKSLEYFEKWKSGTEDLRNTQLPSEWEVKRIQECVEGLFTFAKFKVGDRVKMAATYPINKEDSWGWMAYRHLFKSGSKATVVSVDWYNNTFNYMIEFDQNTWIDDQNNIHPCSKDSHHNFSITEKWLKASK